MDQEQLKEHLRFAAELGVSGISRDPTWRERVDLAVVTTPGLPEASAEAAEPLGAPAPAPMPRTSALISPADVLAAVRVELGPDCSRCKLHTLGRTQVVFGTGRPDADLMFVGEAPGGDEDVQGVPFVGRAGQLLTKIIEAIGLTRDDVYIANVIKCRPPQNRNPEPDEVERCKPFLLRQIAAVKPHVIVALGKFAAQTLLETGEPISRLRGRMVPFGSATLIPTFHPAYVLRNPASKRDVWEDMKLVRRLLDDAERSGNG